MKNVTKNTSATVANETVTRMIIMKAKEKTPAPVKSAAAAKVMTAEKNAFINTPAQNAFINEIHEILTAPSASARIKSAAQTAAAAKVILENDKAAQLAAAAVAKRDEEKNAASRAKKLATSAKVEKMEAELEAKGLGGLKVKNANAKKHAAELEAFAKAENAKAAKTPKAKANSAPVAPRTGKAVNQLDLTTGKVIATFASIADAKRAINNPHAAIVQVTLGRTKSCAGFGWEYAKA